MEFLQALEWKTSIGILSIIVISSISYLGAFYPNPKQIKQETVGGLINDGNTCFMNSVIQALCALESIKRFLKNNQKWGKVSFALDRLIDGFYFVIICSPCPKDE